MLFTVGGKRVNHQAPLYFDSIINTFLQGDRNRSVHLGYYDAALASSGFGLRQAQELFDRRLLSGAEMNPGMNILDVGCGLGGLIDRINSNCEHLDIVGCTNDPRQLEICNSIRPSRGNSLQWIEADACRLPVPTGSFDRIFCIEAAFHFRSRFDFLKEAKRVLKPGGRLICTDIFLKSGGLIRAESDIDKSPVNSPGFARFSKWSIHTLLLCAYAPWPSPWYSIDSLRSDVADAGLVNLKTEDWTKPTRPSYEAMLPSNQDSNVIGTADPMLAALLTLSFLHQNDLLEYVYYSCE
jgi:ubiquinone/menaquinone biosynthesis C-methylase UbiE